MLTNCYLDIMLNVFSIIDPVGQLYELKLRWTKHFRQNCPVFKVFLKYSDKYVAHTY